ncbi:unnamed protein product [Rotaria sordida]|uniref:Prohormone-4 n=1 Tax=Rotaria sordida TaxID=392033 RepID=A0A814SVA5_9BILA|nr:unnamed protein product [Rotaria sordida]CAF0964451.1 unnamed protein product [Rotaria sordida]CAF1153029.1 unnamed protein product [Rotaria sordida]CAF3519946.1 unnamed protein product [Rotaria sordida]CAF3611571.1 unnamed protein product [Rotaria sordida]
MMKSVLPSFAILISSLAILTQIYATFAHAKLSDQNHEPTWLTNSHRNRIDIFKKWLGNKPIGSASNERSSISPYDVLHPTHQFKGCIDPSEPFQCPQSERCIALQFICDGHPGDCPGNLDENEETCIAAKRPAKENIEKFLQAEYGLHGVKLYTFIFGHRLAKSIEENNPFWFDTLASAFSVAKTIRNFAEKTHMTPAELTHFQNIIQMIHDGRLEEIPIFAQEAVNQGLASLVEKLYESGFMDQ